MSISIDQNQRLSTVKGHMYQLTATQHMVLINSYSLPQLPPLPLLNMTQSKRMELYKHFKRVTKSMSISIDQNQRLSTVKGHMYQLTAPQHMVLINSYSLPQLPPLPLLNKTQSCAMCKTRRLRRLCMKMSS